LFLITPETRPVRQERHPGDSPVIKIESGTSMRRQREAHWLPYTPEQMFDLAADIECYPEFLPHWPRATIRSRERDVLYVLQEIDLGLRRFSFESRAVLRRPSHLHIDSTSGPFRCLAIDWRFTSGEQGGCLTALTVEIEMRSALLEAFAGRLMQMMTQDILERFRTRAAALYG
jgi:coenzyme Q-binding protein COQ10